MESAMGVRSHWDTVYRSKAHEAMSWYRAHLERSLALIERVSPNRDAAIIDVGAGESTLVDDLVARGYRHVAVLDVSPAAIEAARRRLGERAGEVEWLVADVTQAALPAAAYDVWHDRAVFHFLTGAAERAAYVRQVARAVKPGGHVIVATFGPEGPTKCSGLEVVRYDARALHGEFGAQFRLIASDIELHRTPADAEQQFLYCLRRVERP